MIVNCEELQRSESTHTEHMFTSRKVVFQIPYHFITHSSTCSLTIYFVLIRTLPR